MSPDLPLPETPQPAVTAVAPVAPRPQAELERSAADALSPRPPTRMLSPGDHVHRARGELQRAQDRLSKALLGAVVRRESEAWNNLYYSSSTRSALEKRAKAFVDAHPDLAAIVEAPLAEVYARFDALDKAKADLKTAQDQRKSKLAAKTKEKESLGTNLPPRASPETYLALRKGLKELETQLTATFLGNYTAMRDEVARKLEEAGGNFELAYPVPSFQAVQRKEVSPEAAETLRARRDAARRWVTYEGGAYRIPPDSDLRLEQMAKRDADESIAGFSGKPAGKIDSAKTPGALVSEVNYRGSMNPMRWSQLDVGLSDGTKQVWETKIIINRSVYNLLFNQWPTRRVS